MEVVTTEAQNGTHFKDNLKVKPEEMTSRDYYFDSYAHFGIHEEMVKIISNFFYLLKTNNKTIY